MANLLKRKNVLIVKNYLQEINHTIKLIELDVTARTAQDAARSLNKDVGAIVKSLLFKTNTDEFYLCLVSGDKYISEKKLSEITQKKIFKATADEVKDKTGFSIGGVAPVAHKTSPSRIFIDSSLNRFDQVFAAAGHPYVVFGINFNLLCKIAKAEIFEITI